MVKLVKTIDPSANSLFDYGCGRGWFLEVARKAGFSQLAGADGSSLAASLLRSNGFECLTTHGEVGERFSTDSLSFQPDVVTMLDVVEHFPGSSLVQRFTDLVGTWRSTLRLVVVKVPLSTGLLYRVAAGLAAVGLSGPIEQLYQVGTSPPHESYFCEGSALELFARSGLEVQHVERDRDFEPESLAARARAFKRLPVVARMCGEVAALVSARCGLEDSGIFFARPSAGGGGRHL